jgi:hypothetical protein
MTNERPEAAQPTGQTGGVDTAIERPDAAQPTGIEITIERPEAAQPTSIEMTIEQPESNVERKRKLSNGEETESEIPDETQDGDIEKPKRKKGKRGEGDSTDREHTLLHYVTGI